MLETLKLGMPAFLFLAVALIIDLWALAGPSAATVLRRGCGAQVDGRSDIAPR
jgi:hypothetical protein